MKLKQFGLTALLSVTAVAFSSDLLASDLFASGTPAGWGCAGDCGVIGSGSGAIAPDLGDVVQGLTTLPSGVSTNYGFVTTAGGADGVGALAGYGDSTDPVNPNSATNGSVLTSTTFSATAGDPLRFAFNFVTTDGSTYTDYAWARLNDITAPANSVLLFTARTSPSGDTSPGNGLPANAATLTLTPPTSSIIDTGYSPGGAGPQWTALVNSSGSCWDVGCGYTGWIVSDYAIAATDIYTLSFGVTNWGDTFYDSALAFDNLTLNGNAIAFAVPGPVPEPGSLVLLGLGFTGLSFMRRFKAAV